MKPAPAHHLDAVVEVLALGEEGQPAPPGRAFCIYDSPMLAFELRRAAPDDADAVADIWLRSRAAASENIPAPVHPEAEVREWIAQRVLVDGECWVAQTPAGEIIAMLALEGGWVEQLYVSPDHQREGVGSALLDVARSRAPGGLQLWTFQANLQARRFYERYGFVCVERTDGSGNEEHAPDMRYVLAPTAT